VVEQLVDCSILKRTEVVERDALARDEQREICRSRRIGWHNENLPLVEGRFLVERVLWNERTIQPGVTGEAVNEAACDVFEREGYPTLRTDEATEDGFTSATGHGVGLDVHEKPKLSWGGGKLRPGHVVTVELGLCEQGIGGVRLEDLVVVTKTGYENLTDYPRELGVV